MLMHVHNPPRVLSDRNRKPASGGDSHCEGPVARFRRGRSARMSEVPRLLFHFDRVFTLRQHQAHPSTFT